MIGFAVELPEGIFASIAGESVIGAKSWDDLPANATWVTTLRQGNQALIKNPELLKHDAFFSIPVSVIGRECGHSSFIDHASIRHVSEVFDRVVRLTAKHFSIKGEALARDIDRSRFFFEVVREQLNFDHKVTLNSSGRDGANKARIWTKGDHVPNNHIGFQISKPRYITAYESLSVPIPSGSFHEMSLIGDRGTVINWLKTAKPAFCRARFIAVEPLLNEVIPLRYARGHEFWVAHPELVLFANLGVIEIKKCFIAEAYLPAKEVLPSCLMPPDPVDIISVSSGIFAENYLRAITDVAITPGSQNDGKLTAATWIASAVRAETMMTAMRLKSRGITILSIDSTSILASVENNDDVDYLHDTCDEIGVIACRV